MKKWLDGWKFSYNEEMISDTYIYFDGLAKSHYLEQKKREKTEHHWATYIKQMGQLRVKITKYFSTFSFTITLFIT